MYGYYWLIFTICFNFMNGFVRDSLHKNSNLKSKTKHIKFVMVERNRGGMLILVKRYFKKVKRETK